MSGENAPPTGSVVPAVSDGVNASLPGQLIVNDPVRVTTSLGSGLSGLAADHGVSCVCTEWVPQVDGFTNGARGPSNRCTFKRSNGICGLLSKVAVSCPVSGSGSTCPESLMTMPRVLFSTTMYMASNDPNGLSACLAR